MKFLIFALLVVFAIVLVSAAPAHDETIVADIGNGRDAIVISPNDDPNSFLKLLALKKLLLFG